MSKICSLALMCTASIMSYAGDLGFNFLSSDISLACGPNTLWNVEQKCMLIITHCHKGFKKYCGKHVTKMIL